MATLTFMSEKHDQDENTMAMTVTVETDGDRLTAFRANDTEGGGYTGRLELINIAEPGHKVCCYVYGNTMVCFRGPCPPIP